MADGPKMDKRTRGNPLVDREQYLTWWLWVMREEKNKNEKNPMQVQ